MKTIKITSEQIRSDNDRFDKEDRGESIIEW